MEDQLRAGLQITTVTNNNTAQLGLASSGSPLQAQRELANAVSLHQRGRLAAAEQHYRASLLDDPSNLQTHLFLATLYSAEGRFGEAIELLAKALRINAHSADANRFIADTFSSLGLLDEAVVRYERAIDLHPNDAEARNNLGVALYKQRKYEKAVTQYEAALKTQPDNAAAHNNLGNALQQLCRPAEAISHYRAAIAADPQLSRAHHNLGNVLRSLDRHQEALQAFGVALQLNGDRLETWKDIASTLLDIHCYEQAVKECRSALAEYPTSLELLCSLGNALQGTGCFAAAIRQYEDILGIDAHFVPALFSLGNVLQNLRRYGEAIVAYKRALAVQPNADAYNNMGIALQALHKYEESVDCYRAALALQPTNVNARYNLGIVLQETLRLDEARVHMERALKLDPANPEIHRGLAVLFLRLGDAKKARFYSLKGIPGGIDVSRNRMFVNLGGSAHPQVRVLQMLSALGGNVVADDWLADGRFTTTTVIAEFCDPTAPLPRHDIVLNAIGDADRCAQALSIASGLLSACSSPVLNPPNRIIPTARVVNSVRLNRIPGILAPKALILQKSSLESPSGPDDVEKLGFRWPVILRTPGFHTGEYILKVNDPGQLANAAAALPGNELIVIQFHDVANIDGKVRKYRVMTIDGRLYPLHLAISHQWLVHFFSADMAESPNHRREDEAFITNMSGSLGLSAMRALERVSHELQLDYGGIDFSIDSRGMLVVFEANATMVAPYPDMDSRWEYRRQSVRQIHEASRAMLFRKAPVAFSPEYNPAEP